MKAFPLLIALFFVHIICAQTLVEKTIVDSRITTIEIDGANCFDIVLETVEGDEMQIDARIEGEYQKDLFLKVSEEGNTLQVGAEFQPNFIKPNDKLSAHKVVSIALQIRLPQFKSVVLMGTSCNVLAKGHYRKLEVNLGDGQCMLEQTEAEVEVRTQSGDISVVSDMATVLAESKYGTVSKNPFQKGDNSYVLTTVTGNIRLSKTE